MEQDLHHPAPRLPDGWKQFQADNIDITTTSDHPTTSGRHSRSPSVLSNSGYGHVNANVVVQPSQTQNHNVDPAIYGGDPDLGLLAPSETSQFGTHQDISQFGEVSANDSSFPLAGNGSAGAGSNNYFQPTAGTAASTATTSLNTLNPLSPTDTSNTNLEDFYISSTDPASYLSNQFESTTSPPINDSLSPFAPFHNQFDAQQYDFQDNNNLGLHWSHHRSRSDQSDISSNASPFIGSVHSEHGSPFIGGGHDDIEDDLHQAILDLDMGPQYEIQYSTGHSFDTSTLELDPAGFPVDAPLFDRQETYRDYYDQQSQHGSRPTSSSGYQAHSPYTQSIFHQPSNIQTSIPPSFQSPPLTSATSIPEIEVTVAPPTPRSQWNHLDSYFSAPRPYNPQAGSASTHNSPSIPPNFIFNHDITPLALPPQAGRRRAVSDSGTRPSMPPPQGLSRRVSSGSHPYLAVQDSGGSSGRSTPSRGHRKSYSSGSHMTPRDVLELVKNDGPREAKNPKKFVCDYPGCGQRFTRNSNKTTHMLTHTNERPHVCPHCQKDFTRQHDWKRHMELHDPSKKFKCAGVLRDGRLWGCNKEFARKDALSRHFKSQQGRQCIDEVLREGHSLEDIYDQQGISMLSGNSSEDMYEE